MLVNAYESVHTGQEHDTYVTKNELVDLIYPVGSIYISVNNNSPSLLFGGSWIQIEDTFLLGAGANYTGGSTGGAATVTLTATEIPSHNHSVGAHAHGLNSHTHSIGAHAHGLNSHTHTYDKANSPTGGPSTNTSGSTAITVAQLPSHNHKNADKSGFVYWRFRSNVSGMLGGVTGNGSHMVMGSNDTSAEKWNDASIIDHTANTGSGSGHTHTLSSHTHTNSYTSTNSGAASGNTANSTAFTSGEASGNTANSTAFNTGAKGGGEAHENMPPYLVVYIWKRVA